MATERIFHEDSRQIEFTAQVTDAGDLPGESGAAPRPYVALDRTAFYPTSGGQPHDTGEIEGIKVVEVLEESAGGRILHVLERRLPGQPRTVGGRIDWPRRFDHMQQHTGQHLLSRAFIRVMKAPTAAFHLGEQVSVDLETASMSHEDADAVEDLLASVIREDRPIVPRWVAPSEVPGGVEIPQEAARCGRVRLVEVADFDLEPCCGTHCGRTGEVEAVVILGWERVGRRTRIFFLCGERARLETRRRMRWSSALAKRLSLDVADLPGALERQLEDSKQLRRERADLIQRLTAFEAAGLPFEPGERYALLARDLGERPTEEALALSRAAVSRPRTVVLLVWKDGDGARVLASRSEDLDLDLRPAIAAAAEILGGRGGGRPASAQGGGPRVERLTEAMEALRSRLTASGSSSTRS